MVIQHKVIAIEHPFVVLRHFNSDTWMMYAKGTGFADGQLGAVWSHTLTTTVAINNPMVPTERGRLLGSGENAVSLNVRGTGEKRRQLRRRVGHMSRRRVPIKRRVVGPFLDEREVGWICTVVEQVAADATVRLPRWRHERKEDVAHG